ncbi:MAG: PhoH family protein [Oligoflexales bacterium]
MKKIFILDTNILLSDPASVFKFEDNDVVIPISVIEEIDRFKKNQSEKGRNAREVSRILDRLRKKGSLTTGVPLDDAGESGVLTVHLGQNKDILPELLEDSTDNNILAVALELQKEAQGRQSVQVISKDTNLRIKSDAFGLEAADFEADKVDISHLFQGYRKVGVDSEVLDSFEMNQEVSLEDMGVPNEFFIMEDNEDTSRVCYGRNDSDLGRIVPLEDASEGVWGVFPRNEEQSLGLAALVDDSIKLVTLSGGAGTGKTLLAIAAGLSKTTDEEQYQKLLVARPIFAMGQDMGFLPGDLEEKLNPWMQPIYDSLDFLLSGGAPGRQKRLSNSYQELINQGLLAIEPLTYIRGRSLPSSFFVVDEAQNLTPHEVKTILTRAGDGTKIILTGDPYQIDNPYIDSTNNGLTYVIERFQNSKIAAHVSLKHGERSELASLAAQLL